MAAVAHNPAFAKKVGISQKVGKEFDKADKGKKFKGGGLYENINAKRERIAEGSGERMRRVGSKGAPTAGDFKQSAKTAKLKDGGVSLAVGRGEKLSTKEGAGLTQKGRDKYNRETGSNLKAPQPQGGARKGGMPLYKYIGNKILTYLQNRLAKVSLTEWHSGYRAYSVLALRKVNFMKNSDYFDFDSQIILQMIGARQRIVEIEIPTFYGDEISRVNGIKYGLKILIHTLKFRLSSNKSYF